MFQLQIFRYSLPPPKPFKLNGLSRKFTIFLANLSYRFPEKILDASICTVVYLHTRKQTYKHVTINFKFNQLMQICKCTIPYTIQPKGYNKVVNVKHFTFIIMQQMGIQTITTITVFCTGKISLYSRYHSVYISACDPFIKQNTCTNL